MLLIPSKALLPQAFGSKNKDFITCTVFLLFLIGGKYNIYLNNFPIQILFNYSWSINLKTYGWVFLFGRRPLPYKCEKYT